MPEYSLRIHCGMREFENRAPPGAVLYSGINEVMVNWDGPEGSSVEIGPSLSTVSMNEWRLPSIWIVDEDEPEPEPDYGAPILHIEDVRNLDATEDWPSTGRTSASAVLWHFVDPNKPDILEMLSGELPQDIQEFVRRKLSSMVVNSEWNFG